MGGLYEYEVRVTTPRDTVHLSYPEAIKKCLSYNCIALLEHPSIRTTQIYAKVVESKLIKDMKNLEKWMQRQHADGEQACVRLK